MSDDPSCRAPQAPTGAVPRTCVPFAHVPAVPVVAVPYVPVPVPSGLPVLSVAGVLPDRTGNVDVTRFLEEWAAVPLAGKADKAVPLAAGNLASLDASGNLLDSGATPASIKAAAVAEVVANAPGTLDTLEEIADLLGSAQQSGTVLKRISDLETGKADSSSLAAVATSGSYDDLSGKPTVPAVDAALAAPGAAADAKAVGDALRGGFTEWEFSGQLIDTITYTVAYDYDGQVYNLYRSDFPYSPTDVSYSSDPEETTVYFSDVDITATRHAFPPTKTSQLTNDGDGSAQNTSFVLSNDSRLTNARTPTGHHATHSTGGTDAIAPADIGAAATSDLPYRLVEPGEWEFSDGGTHFVSGPGIDSSGDAYVYWLDDDSRLPSQAFSTQSDALSALSLTFDNFGTTVTATRLSLPGHLCDRAGNRVVVTGDTTLTLPAAVPGYLRDFLVRLEISGSTVPTITFAAPTGETLTYETDGDEFPVPDEAGDWLYSFTESCVAHKFAVSLKKVNEVAQGGS